MYSIQNEAGTPSLCDETPCAQWFHSFWSLLVFHQLENEFTEVNAFVRDLFVWDLLWQYDSYFKCHDRSLIFHKDTKQPALQARCDLFVSWMQTENSPDQRSRSLQLIGNSTSTNIVICQSTTPCCVDSQTTYVVTTLKSSESQFK